MLERVYANPRNPESPQGIRRKDTWRHGDQVPLAQVGNPTYPSSSRADRPSHGTASRQVGRMASTVPEAGMGSSLRRPRPVLNHALEWIGSRGVCEGLGDGEDGGPACGFRGAASERGESRSGQRVVFEGRRNGCSRTLFRKCLSHRRVATPKTLKTSLLRGVWEGRPEAQRLRGTKSLEPAFGKVGETP